MLLSNRMQPGWVLAYDIGEERRRRCYRRVMRRLAEGYQHSVFEVCQHELALMPVLEQLAESMEGDDSLLAARVLPFGHAWQLGAGPDAPSGELVIIS